MPIATVFHGFKSLDMISVGDGDPDVFTKEGRRTFVVVDIQAPQPDESRHRLQTHLFYRISEGRHDWTVLEMSRDIYIPVDSNWKNLKVSILAPYHIETVIYGENHRWNDLAIHDPSFMSMVSVKIDGKGNENNGKNAGIHVNFAVPVEYTLG
jgi:hypothetical protein